MLDHRRQLVPHRGPAARNACQGSKPPRARSDHTGPPSRPFAAHPYDHTDTQESGCRSLARRPPRAAGVEPARRGRPHHHEPDETPPAGRTIQIHRNPGHVLATVTPPHPPCPPNTTPPLTVVAPTPPKRTTPRAAAQKGAPPPPSLVPAPGFTGGLMWRCGERRKYLRRRTTRMEPKASNHFLVFYR